LQGKGFRPCDTFSFRFYQKAYDAACAEGRALTVDEAVAYALGEATWDELTSVVAERLAGEGGQMEAEEETAGEQEEMSPADD
jgi:hypothetical protein